MFKPLIRILPSLSGNIKIASKVSDITEDKENNIYNAYVREAYLFPLSEDLLTNTRIKANLLTGMYHYDIKNFYDIYSGNFYNTQDNEEFKDVQVFDKTKINNLRGEAFESGVKRISYQVNGNEFEYFAPIYIDNEKDIPTHFILKITAIGNRISKEKIVKIRIRQEDKYKDKYNYLGVYLSKYAKELDEHVIMCLPHSNECVYSGIYLKDGGFANIKDIDVPRFFNKQTTINNLDFVVAQGFQRHSMVMKQILPLSFLINLDNIFTNEEKALFNFHEIKFAGNYYNGDKMIEWCDFDIDYQEFYTTYYKFNISRNMMDLYKSTKNIMDISTILGALKEKTFIKYKYSNKILPDYTRWKLLYSKDENPYIFNLNSAYSVNDLNITRYGAYPYYHQTIFGISRILDKAQDNDTDFGNDLVLPFRDKDNKFYQEYYKDSYNAFMNNYLCNWFISVPLKFEDNLETFVNQRWEDVHQDGKVYFKDILYDLSNVYDDEGVKINIDKFGVFLRPSLSILKESDNIFNFSEYSIFLDSGNMIDNNKNCSFNFQNKTNKLLPPESYTLHNDEFTNDRLFKDTGKTLQELWIDITEEKDGKRYLKDEYKNTSYIIGDEGRYILSEANPDYGIEEGNLKEDGESLNVESEQKGYEFAENQNNLEVGFYGNNIWYRHKDIKYLLDDTEYAGDNYYHDCIFNTCKGYVELPISYISQIKDFIAYLKNSENEYIDYLNEHLYVDNPNSNIVLFSECDINEFDDNLRYTFYLGPKRILHNEEIDDYDFVANTFINAKKETKHLREVLNLQNSTKLIEYHYLPDSFKDGTPYTQNVFTWASNYTLDFDNDEDHQTKEYRGLKHGKYIDYFTNYLKNNKYSFNDYLCIDIHNLGNIFNLFKFRFNEITPKGQDSGEQEIMLGAPSYDEYGNFETIERYCKFLNVTHIDAYLNKFDKNFARKEIIDDKVIQVNYLRGESLSSDFARMFIRKRYIKSYKEKIELKDKYINLCPGIIKRIEGEYEYYNTGIFANENFIHFNGPNVIEGEETLLENARRLTRIFINHLENGEKDCEFKLSNNTPDEIVEIIKDIFEIDDVKNYRFELFYKFPMVIINQRIFDDMIFNHHNKNYKDLYVYKIESPEDFKQNIYFEYDNHKLLTRHELERLPENIDIYKKKFGLYKRVEDKSIIWETNKDGGKEMTGNFYQLVSSRNEMLDLNFDEEYVGKGLKDKNKEKIPEICDLSLESIDMGMVPLFNSVYLQGKDTSLFYRYKLKGKITPVYRLFRDVNIIDPLPEHPLIIPTPEEGEKEIEYPSSWKYKIYGYSYNSSELLFTHEIKAEQIDDVGAEFRENQKIYRNGMHVYELQSNHIFNLSDNNTNEEKKEDINHINNLTIRNVNGKIYGYYLINADLDNTKNCYNVFGSRNDILEETKYIDSLGGISFNTLMNDDILYKYFWLSIPFLKINIFNIFKQLPLKYNQFTSIQKIDFILSKKIYENDYTDIILYDSKASVTLNRYLDNITPFIDERNVLNNTFIRKYKASKTNNVKNLIQRYPLNMDVYQGVNIFTSENIYKTYYPVEYKHFNDSKYIYLPKHIELQAYSRLDNKLQRIYEMTFEDVKELEKLPSKSNYDRRIFTLFKELFNGKNYLINDEILFLFNKYDVSFDVRLIEKEYTKDEEKLYTLTYKLNLI